MASGTETLTGGNPTAVLLAADEYRDFVLIQLQSNHPTYLGFGEAAVSAQGVCLMEPGATAKVRGSKARGAIQAIAAGNAVLGWETMEEIDYQSGQFAGPWPAS
jgi:hypothetical protein